MLVPVGAEFEKSSGMDDDIDLDTIEVKEGESLEDIKGVETKEEEYQLVNTANTYDDKRP